MFAKAKAILLDRITAVQSYDQFKRVLEEKGGFIKAAWCGSVDCEAKVKDETGATIRVIPFQKEEPATDCIVCGQKAKETAYFARSY
jgi:prolyl-tRNA synthetase